MDLFEDIYYSDIKLLPLDTPGKDGNNVSAAEPLAPTEEEFALWAKLDFEASAPLLLAGPRKRRAIYVPLKRHVKLGTLGPDAFAVKRALSKAGYGKWGGWGSKPKLFGPYAVRNLKAFQKKKGLKADGEYGRATHNALAKHFDAHGRWLMGQVVVFSPEELKRQKIVATAMHGYNNRYSIHYTQSWLRMSGVKGRLRPPAFGRYEDCSSFATWCYWVAGVSDPNQLGYNGYGYTGTLADHGTRISTASMKPGDLVFYGSYPHSHVTVYIGAGRCVSHGNESGPSILPYNYRSINSVRSYL